MGDGVVMRVADPHAGADAGGDEASASYDEIVLDNIETGDLVFAVAAVAGSPADADCSVAYVVQGAVHYLIRETGIAEVDAPRLCVIHDDAVKHDVTGRDETQGAGHFGSTLEISQSFRSGQPIVM